MFPYGALLRTCHAIQASSHLDYASICRKWATFIAPFEYEVAESDLVWLAFKNSNLLRFGFYFVVAEFTGYDFFGVKRFISSRNLYL